MRRRIPDAVIRLFSPRDVRVAMDPDLVTEPLGSWSFQRAAELAAELDLIVVGGGEIMHAHDEFYDEWYGDDAGVRLRPSEYFVGGLGRELEKFCPIAWHCVGVPFALEGETAALARAGLRGRRYIAVRDELSKERLLQIDPGSNVEVVPDSGLLLDRLFSAEELTQRVARLRAEGALPSKGQPLIVQGSSALLPFVAPIAAAVADLVEESGRDVVLLSTGPCHGDERFADALADRLPSAYRLLPDVAVADVVATLASCAGFVGVSLHGAITATVYGAPAAILNLVGYSKLDGFARLVGMTDGVIHSLDELPDVLRKLSGRTPPNLAPLIARLDAHFDALAEIARESAAARVSVGPAWADVAAAALRTADDRYELAHVTLDRLHREQEALRRQQEELRTELTARVEALTAELAAVNATRLFRYAAPFRRVYQRVRRTAAPRV